MRVVRCLVALLAAAALSATSAHPTAPALAAAGVAPSVIVVGDSLAVGTRPHLGALTPGLDLRWDAQNGRTTPQGLMALRAQLRWARPRAVVVSLGSNDGPSAVRFADRLRRILAAVPGDACVVWPSVVRPPRKGEASGINRVLLRTARRDRRLTVVDWVGAVKQGAVLLPDGLHPDPPGYAERSRMIAAALDRGCPAQTGGAAPAGGAIAPFPNRDAAADAVSDGTT